jgi:hypothetical protein
MAGPEAAKKYQNLIFLAGSASAEFFADIALCPFEAVKVTRWGAPCCTTRTGVGHGMGAVAFRRPLGPGTIGVKAQLQATRQLGWCRRHAAGRAQSCGRPKAVLYTALPTMSSVHTQ